MDPKRKGCRSTPGGRRPNPRKSAKKKAPKIQQSEEKLSPLQQYHIRANLKKQFESMIEPDIDMAKLREQEKNRDTSNDKAMFEQFKRLIEGDLMNPRNNNKYVIGSRPGQEDKDDPFTGRIDDRTIERLEAESFKYTITRDGKTEKLTVKLWFEKEEAEGNPDWVEVLAASIQTKDGTEIGGGFARWIRRGSQKLTFWEDLERISDDVCRLAFGIFTRYGQLKDEIINHPVRKGSSVWGKEVDHGSFLSVDQIMIDEAYRRRGIGLFTIRKMMAKCKGRRAIQWVFMWPSHLRNREELSSVQWDRDHNQVVAWAKSIGFRRIGATDFFGFALDENHKSKTLAAEDDYDLPDINDDLDDDYGEKVEPPPEKSAKKMSEHQARKARRAARERLKETTALLTRRNVQGYTPLELLQVRLDEERGSKLVRLVRLIQADKFEGFSDNDTLCLSLLKFGLDGPGKLEANTQLRLRIRYGCTCGACISGILSPRTRYTLATQAGEIMGMMEMMAEDSEDKFEDLDSKFEGWGWSYYSEVPIAVRDQFKTNKALKKGFLHLLNVIRNVINAKILPRIDTLNKMWQEERESFTPEAAAYLAAGGTFESALVTIFNQARDQDEMTGDGELIDVEKYGQEMNALPKCRNDSEFGVVAKCCGMQGYINGHKYKKWDGSEPLCANMLRGVGFREMGLM
ncbi:hypothetical protein BJ508DRAFT_359244 [Ascobolus immersus RN42]|uniref:Uncharacterized protein n=1 Tax=Ascobolus immersus RN42 TaxID=1160509 RepID=A0A3N4ILZ6_ASCIM|nr:hypothetical protein BJ508DRAFT_359244 [Ascobolus immersus RN42]